MRKIAFTLAEVLITIGIIGVVSALAVPNLSNSTSDMEKVAKLKKIYQNLSDAHDRAVTAYGPISHWFTDEEKADPVKANTRYAERMFDFLKIDKTCPSTKGCFANKNMPGLTSNTCKDCSNYHEFLRPKAITADGTSLMFILWSPNCKAYKSPGSDYKDVCGWIGVDIDGPNKGENVMGKDIFRFGVSKKAGIYPLQYVKDAEPYVSEYETSIEKCITNGEYCAVWILENENMDYLKCPSQLSVNNTTCE